MPFLRSRPTRPARVSARGSIVLGIVAVIVVASPAAVLIAGSTPETTANKHQPSVQHTSISEVSLAQVPSLVLNLVNSGLARVGVRLPPIDLSAVTLPDIPLHIPDGLLPSGVLPTPDPGSQAKHVPPRTANRTPLHPAAAHVALPKGQAGAVVKEITRHNPFSMIGLTWNGIAGTTAYIRARQPNGSWGPWIAADPAQGTVRKSTVDPTRQGTEPIWVGNTTAVQVAVTNNGIAAAAPLGSAPSPSTGATTPVVPAPQGRSAQPDPVQPQSDLPTTSAAVAPRAFHETPSASEPSAPNPGNTAGNALQQAISTLSAALITPGKSGTPPAGSVAATTPPGAKPPITSRAQWGADESLRCSQPTIDNSLNAAIVHHTAGANDYTPQQSAEIVRGIYAYHTQTLGWCDIGYNALVDKYGQIFEGAAGGLDKNVEGTHTGGFNPDTVGVAMIGNLDEVPPTPAMLNSVGRFLGWRLKLAGLDPKGRSHLTSQGFDSSHFAAGEVTDLPMITGHRDYDATECPGQYGYAALPQIRDIAAGGPLLSDGASQAQPGAGTTPSPTSAAPTPPGANLLAANDTGEIAKKWLSTGGATGPLGVARTPETTTPDGKAKFADFANGAIYWSKETGAQIIQGLIQKAWAGMGYEKSALGLPTSSEIDSNGLITQWFQFGSLVFNTITGGIIKVLKTYVDTYNKALHGAAATGPVLATPAR